MVTYKETLKKKKDKHDATTAQQAQNNSGKPQRAICDPYLQSRIDYTTLRDWLFERLMDQI